MAVPVLEFLSTLVRLPKLFANFVEDQYLSVFAIALPYTNPKRFNHLAVSLAYAVIASWFIKCRPPFRKGFVAFITKALKANIQEEVIDRSSSSFFCGDAVSGAPASATSSTTTSSSSSSTRDRKASAPGGDMFLPLNQSSLKLHTELIECCVDLMARHAHSYFSLLPRRSPVAEFLLKDGQTCHWLVGTAAVVSITTSSSAGSAINNGLCDKCARMTTATPAPSADESGGLHTTDDDAAFHGSSETHYAAAESKSVFVVDKSQEGSGVRERKRHRSTMTQSTSVKPTLPQPKWKEGN